MQFHFKVEWGFSPQSFYHCDKGLQPHLLSLTYLFLLLFEVLDPNFSFPIVDWSHASDILSEV
jgi:hypothetical protein